MAIKTEYKGILFRSMLEATWAAFFDNIMWNWIYEPQAEMNNWIPDFGLYTEDKNIIYCEVKPYTTIGEFKSEKKLIDNSDHEILCLGLAPCNEDDIVYIGFIIDKYIGFDHCIIGAMPEGLGGYDFYSENGSWKYRLSGLYDGNDHIWTYEPDEIMKFWTDAKNTVQWKK